MTPDRRRQLLSATHLGNWLLTRVNFDFDESKVHRDHGKFAPGDDGAGADWPSAHPGAPVYPGDLPVEVRNRGGAWAADLSSGQRWALQDYARTLYGPVNRALRDAGGDPAAVPAGGQRWPASHHATTKEGVDLLLSAAAAHPVNDPPLVCWRLLQLKHEKMDAFVAAASAAEQTGADFKMPTFGSATLNPQFAGECAAGTAATTGPDSKDPITGAPSTKRGIMLEIRARSGMLIGAAGLSNLDAENEILQPPTAKYRVLGFHDVKFGMETARVLRLEELPPDPTDRV